MNWDEVGIRRALPPRKINLRAPGSELPRDR